jgi:hypothetical protein
MSGIDRPADVVSMEEWRRMDRDEVNLRATECEHGYRIASGDDVDHLASRLPERPGYYPGTESGPDNADPHLPGVGSIVPLAQMHRGPQPGRKLGVSSATLPFWSLAVPGCTSDLDLNMHVEEKRIQDVWI